MQIVLNQEDIEKLVRAHYDGVTEIFFNTKKPKITLEVETIDFVQTTSPKPTVKPQPVIETDVSVEERAKERRKVLEGQAKVMASGGEERNRSLKVF